MIGQISASNQLRTSSELAPNMFGASSELASVMAFGFNCSFDEWAGGTVVQSVRRGLGGVFRVVVVNGFSFTFNCCHTFS